jgi:hypothetical protein
MLWTLGAASIVVFRAGLLLMPALAVRIRPGYFTHDERPPSRRAGQHGCAWSRDGQSGRG